MHIVALDSNLPTHIDAAAALLRIGFPADPVYATEAGSLEEIEEVLRDGVGFGAFDGTRLIGWIGALIAYRGMTWELHPLVVAPDARRRGVGRALVTHLEEVARAAGVWTIMLGTDDEHELTTASLPDDLYAELPNAIAHLTTRDPAHPHPVDFYRACGYHVVGILPDANGARKPDIFMAKRIR